MANSNTNPNTSTQSSTDLFRRRGVIETFFIFCNPLTVISAFGLLFVTLYEHNFDFSLLNEILIDFFKEFFIAVFIVGSVAIFMELTHYGRNLINSLRKMMTTYDFIKDLEWSRLKALKREVDKRLYYGTNDPTSFFYVVEDEISNFLNECYYKEYINDVECIINDEKKYMKKIITRVFTIVNPTFEKKSKTVPVGAYMTPIKDVDDSELYKITKCRVTIGNQIIDKNIKLSIERCNNLPTSGDPIYEVDISGQFTIEIEDSCSIELVAESLVPITDIHYQHRITAPCKRFSSNFMLSNSSPYRVNGFGFGFMDEKKLKIIPYKNTNGVRIEFNGWILPGDGVIFTIAKDMV